MFLLLFLVINIIASIEIKKEQYLKSIKSLKHEAKNLVEKLDNSYNFWDQLLEVVITCGKTCAINWCKQFGFDFCKDVINSIMYSDPL